MKQETAAERQADARYRAAVRYIRRKVDQLLTVMGTQPLRAEELDDDTLLELDPIGIVAESFAQVMQNLSSTNHALTVAKNEIRAILDSMQAGVVVINRDGTVEDCNRQALEWLFCGAERETVLGAEAQKVCCGGDPNVHFPKPGNSREISFGGRHYQVVASEIANEAGALEKTVFLCFDITRQKATEASLELYAKTFNNTAEGILITDAKVRIVEVNRAFCRITGYSAEELLGNRPTVLKSGMHDSRFYEEMWRSIRERGYWQGEVIDRAKDGSLIPLLQTISEVRDNRGTVTNYISLVTDISSLKETQERLDFLAHHDPLTELPNRLLLNDRVSQAIEKARRDQSVFALLFIDLDRFKTINDSLGHHFGDHFLLQVAKRLKALVRGSDTVARLGGDEFVILIERLKEPSNALLMADKIVKALRQPFDINGTILHIGCSIGVTLYPEDGLDAVTLLKNADAAMYRVKEAGRDGFYKFSQELSEAADEKLTLENALRLAIRDDAFRLHYQPIVDLKAGRIVAAEALIRWTDPTLGMISPDRFIPLAEETKLINTIGAWVAEEAIRQFRRWREAGVRLDYISLNVSGSQVFANGFAEGLIGASNEQGVEGHAVQIELTENVLMRDVESCRYVFDRLRKHGFRIAIDDFGTGYSSLAYLKELPIDNLKLDRTFVRDIPEDPNDCAIAHAVIGLAHHLGLEAVAEGIENASQEQFLREINCTTVQGFFYSRPLPAEDFAAFFHDFELPA